jgi:hypothetical protein
LFSFPKAALVTAGAFIALVVAPAALAEKFGPDLRVEGQSLTTSVALTVRLSPSYSTSKPGVTVTMTKCGAAQVRLVRRLGGLGSGQTFRASAGKLVWTLASVPAKPAKPTLNLRLAVPKGAKTLCVRTSMYDSYTKQTVNVTNRIPL